ncbi:MAG TPA: hypothetical protein VG603_06595 [Chitinophagales bacterium]|nr:hypothetical protein [Chitinophagales bacterium]
MKTVFIYAITALFFLPHSLFSQVDSSGHYYDFKAIKKRSDFPKGYFSLDFREKNSEPLKAVETLWMKYIEVGLDEMPKYHITFDPISAVGSSGAGGFGAWVEASIKPVKFLDIHAGLFAPYVVFQDWDYQKDLAGVKYNGTYHFFTCNIAPAALLTVKTKVRLRRSGMVGSQIDYKTYKGYIFKIPTVVTHQIGLQPVYYYTQGTANFEVKDIPAEVYGFRNHVIGGNIMYKRTSHAVINVKDHRIHRYSTILYVYAGFLYGASINSNAVGTIGTDTAAHHFEYKVAAPFKDKLGYLAGIEYQVTFNTGMPFYLNGKLEFGRMPALQDHSLFNVSLGFTFYVSRSYYKKYKLN